MKYSASQRYSLFFNTVLILISLGYIGWVVLRPLFVPDVNWAVYIVPAVAVVLPVGTTLLILLSKLTLKIDETGVHYKYWPAHRDGLKYIPWNNVQYIYVREVKPIKEYGGWGIRYSSRRGQAYILSGKYGLQLHLKTGEALLIGVKDPQKMIAFLDKLMENDIISRDLLPPATPFS